MEKRKLKKTYPVRPKLVALIERWNLPMVTLAAEMGMLDATFRAKVNKNMAIYGFTDEEYLEAVGAIEKMADEMKKFCRNNDLSKKSFKKPAKSKILFQKNTPPPVF